MTGYGSASRQIDLASGGFANLQVEIRAVNSRFLDLSFRLPDECRSAESALRELLQKQLKRGKVELRAAWRLGYSDAGSNAATIQLQQADLIAKREAGYYTNIGQVNQYTTTAIGTYDQTTITITGNSNSPTVSSSGTNSGNQNGSINTSSGAGTLNNGVYSSTP